MKLSSKYLAGLLPLVIFMFALIGNNSCKKIENPNSDLNIKDTLKYDYIETRVFVEFVDANTGEYLTTSQGDVLKVEIEGVSREVVADIIGFQDEYYLPQKGFISFGLLPEFMPSTASPVRFTVKASLYGYLTQFKEISITEPGDYYLRVSMINLADPPEGIIIETQNNVGNLYNGVVFDDVTISTSGGEATFIIPSGTKLMDADTNNLAGRLNLTLVYHNTGTDNGLRTAQGGVNSTVIKNNTKQNVLFGAGGLVTFLISDSDYKYATFIQEKKLEYAVKINSSIINPNTGANYTPGNRINFCSFDADTGMYIYHKRDSIKVGNFAHGTTSQIGSYCYGNYTETTCNSNAGFKFADGCAGCASTLVSGTMRKSSDNSFISDVFIAGTNGESNYISGTAGSNPVLINWRDNPDSSSCIVNPAFNPTIIENMCSQNVLNLPLLDQTSGLISADLNFQGVCPIDTNYVIFPSLGIWLRNANSNTWHWYSMINGKATVCNLKPMESYIVGTYFNSSWHEWEFVANETESYEFRIYFNDDICTNVFGIL